ncbi:hypothetical protein GCM10009648_39090 [Tsukamurella spumae]
MGIGKVFRGRLSRVWRIESCWRTVSSTHSGQVIDLGNAAYSTAVEQNPLIQWMERKLE